MKRPWRSRCCSRCHRLTRLDSRSSSNRSSRRRRSSHRPGFTNGNPDRIVHGVVRVIKFWSPKLTSDMPVVCCDHKRVPAVDAEQLVQVLAVSLLALPTVCVMGSSGAGPPVAVWAEETVAQVAGRRIWLTTDAPPHGHLLKFKVKVKDKL